MSDGVIDLEIRTEVDEMSALVTVVRPILLGLLRELKAEVVKEVGGYENVKLRTLSQFRSLDGGDCNLCFEYATHDAMRRGDTTVCEQLFYTGWQVVQAFLSADAQMPTEEALPRPAMREVARMLVDRREFSVLKVHKALEAFALKGYISTAAGRRIN